MNKPASITKQDAEKIISRLDERDADIFRISFETGLRISDILKLRIHDVQKNPLEIRETKTKKLRIVKITDEFSDYLRKKYKFRWSFAFGNGGKLLFEGNRGTGKAIDRSTYHRRLKRASEALQINFSAHSGRKLYARSVFEQTKSILEVQKALNHKYLTTTATYLDIDLDEMLKKSEPT